MKVGQKYAINTRQSHRTHELPLCALTAIDEQTLAASNEQDAAGATVYGGKCSCRTQEYQFQIHYDLDQPARAGGSVPAPRARILRPCTRRCTAAGVYSSGC